MTCRICGSDEVSGHFSVAEMMYGTRERFGYFQCGRCNCLQIDVIPDDMHRFYGGAYYSYSEAVRKRNPLKRWIARWRGQFALHGAGVIGRLLYRRSPDTELRSLRPFRLGVGSRVLDVGCGAGHLLFALGELGLRNVAGIDPFIPAEVVYENGVRVSKLDIFQVQGPWDVIMFHHSFEHLSDPKATLARVAQLLVPGGRCLLRVPTVTSYAWQHYAVNWVQLDAPRHLYLFAHESIQHLARNTGFEVERIECDSTAFQFWGSEQYLRDVPLFDQRSASQSRGLFSAAQMENFKSRAVELNREQRGDQAAFYLRKL